MQAKLEAPLVQRVPELLEAMNRAAEKVNLLEGRRSQAQHRHQQLVAQSEEHYTKLRTRYGRSEVDAASRLLEAEKADRVASKRARAAFRAISRADQAEGLDAVCAVALIQQQEARHTLTVVRDTCNDHVLQCTLPCLRSLQQHRDDVRRMQQHIAALDMHLRAARKLYAMSMAELEELSMTIHAMRMDAASWRLDETASQPGIVVRCRSCLSHAGSALRLGRHGGPDMDVRIARCRSSPLQSHGMETMLSLSMLVE